MKGRRKRGVKAKTKPTVKYGSDDERAYSKEPVPDKQSREYYYDEVDEFHAKKDKILLDNKDSDNESDVQEEVLAFDDDSDASDDDYAMYKEFQRNYKKETLGSDLEDTDEEDEEEKMASWGKKKSAYFGADVTEVGQLADQDSEEAVALLEEQEALALQKKMTEQLDENDFELEFFNKAATTSTDVDKEKDETIQISKDLSKLSRDEKLKLLQKESPELMDLIKECKQKLQDVMYLQPIQRLIRCGEIPQCKAATYIETKIKLSLNYCINITFYLMLKAKKTPIRNHPVMKRISQYRKIIEQLEPIGNQLSTEIALILDKIKRKEPLNFKLVENQDIVRKRKVSFAKIKKSDKRLSDLISDDEENGGDMEEENDENNEEDALHEGGRSWGRKRLKLDEKEENSDEHALVEDDNEEEGKRGITYQIEKNKGLTPHRKKEYRNPRVKHKLKYRKAKIRRKGMVREPRTEMTRYGGELSGIRAGIKRSIKLK